MSNLMLALVALLVLPEVSSSQQNWVQFASDRGGFSVAMPIAPTESRDKNTSPEAGPFESFLYIARSPDEIYLAGWVEYQPSYNFGIQPELLANRDNFVKGLQGTLIDSKSIRHGDYPGIEFTANVRVANNQPMFITSRVFIVGRLPIMVAIATPPGVDRTANIQRFLSSFQVTRR